jgi:hypothetical protein
MRFETKQRAQALKTYIGLAVLLASLLGGCATIRDYERASATPQVTVAGGRISVSPDPLLFGKEQQNVLIVWQLPKGTNLRFPEGGIVIEGEITSKVLGGSTDRGAQNNAAPSIVINRDQTEIVDCKARNEGLEFTCLNRHTRPGLYKYSIRVLEDGKPLEPLDPSVMNG